MKDLLLVGGGGFLGSVARYLLGGLVLHATGAPRFPWSTLFVNATGCLAIGVLAGFAERAHVLSPATRLFLITGFLGGYTTFSTFSLQTLDLMQKGQVTLALVNVASSVILCLLGVWLGFLAGRAIS